MNYLLGLSLSEIKFLYTLTFQTTEDISDFTLSSTFQILISVQHFEKRLLQAYLNENILWLQCNWLLWVDLHSNSCRFQSTCRNWNYNSKLSTMHIDLKAMTSKQTLASESAVLYMTLGKAWFILMPGTCEILITKLLAAGQREEELAALPLHLTAFNSNQLPLGPAN